MATTQFNGPRIKPGSIPFDRLDAVTQATISALQAGAKRVHDVAGMQSNATLDPGASPATGVRYILLNTASLHANFGTITGVSDGDIVEWDGAKFVVSVDISAETQTLQVWNDGDKHYWIGDPESASATKWAQGPGLGSFPFDPTTSRIDDSNITVQDALKWLADTDDLQVVSDISFCVADVSYVTGFVAGSTTFHPSIAISAGQKILVVADGSVFTVQVSGGPLLTVAPPVKISLFTVHQSWWHPAASTGRPGLYLFNPSSGAAKLLASADSYDIGHKKADGTFTPVRVELQSLRAAVDEPNPMIYSATAADSVTLAFDMGQVVPANAPVWADGQMMREGASYDYTVSGSVITFNAIPPASWVGMKVK